MIPSCTKSMKSIWAGLVVLVVSSALPLSATIWSVTSTGDVATDPTTLRGAINAAASGDSIVFNLPAYPATIMLSEGTPLEISKNLDIDGHGQSNLAISGGGTVQVFLIDSGATVKISGVTIEKGGGLFVSGGINNNGTLTLVGSTLSGNSNTANGAGGIWNTGILTVVNSTLSSNSNFSTVGGILNNGGTVTITDSTLSGNSGGIAGGILNDNAGTVNITNSTFSGNSASGALSASGIYNRGTLTLSNSTLSGNPASSASSAGGILSEATGHTVTAKNTIVANSLPGGNCFVVSAGTITSLGYNLSDDTSCTSFFTQTTDLNNKPAGLDPSGLQNNPGPPVPTLGVPQTIALLSTSLAVDAIPVSSCTDVNGNPVTTDERGWPRPQGPACDIGAYELVLSISAKLTVIHLNSTIDIFNLNATFTPGAASDGIYPLTEPVTLQVGPYRVTIPAGSFREILKGPMAGSYVYLGVIGGAALSIQIVPPSNAGHVWNFNAIGVTDNVTYPPVPCAVTIAIGDDSGGVLVQAVIL